MEDLDRGRGGGNRGDTVERYVDRACFDDFY